VTEYVRQQKAAGARFVTFGLSGRDYTTSYVRFNSDEAADAATRPQLFVEPEPRDRTGPTIVATTAGSSAWTPEFIAALAARGLGDGGYAVPAERIQYKTRVLPWTGLDTIRIRFNEDVRVSADHLRVIEYGAAEAAHAIRDFSYDPATHVATWVLEKPLAAEDVRLELEGDSPGAVTDTSGNRFRGGDEAPADIAIGFRTFPGDVNEDSRVNALDMSFVKQRLNTNATDSDLGGYNPLADVTGDGRINASDLAAVKQRLNNSFFWATHPDSAAAAAPFSAAPVKPRAGVAENLAALLE
jgi:hypothetical protein